MSSFYVEGILDFGCILSNKEGRIGASGCDQNLIFLVFQFCWKKIGFFSVFAIM